jgi:hypothetical protein
MFATSGLPLHIRHSTSFHVIAAGFPRHGRRFACGAFLRGVRGLGWQSLGGNSHLILFHTLPAAEKGNRNPDHRQL